MFLSGFCTLAILMMDFPKIIFTEKRVDGIWDVREKWQVWKREWGVGKCLINFWDEIEKAPQISSWRSGWREPKWAAKTWNSHLGKGQKRPHQQEMLEYNTRSCLFYYPLCTFSQTWPPRTWSIPCVFLSTLIALHLPLMQNSPLTLLSPVEKEVVEKQISETFSPHSCKLYICSVNVSYIWARVFPCKNTGMNCYAGTSSCFSSGRGSHLSTFGTLLPRVACHMALL